MRLTPGQEVKSSDQTVQLRCLHHQNVIINWIQAVLQYINILLKILSIYVFELRIPKNNCLTKFNGVKIFEWTFEMTIGKKETKQKVF